MLQKIRLLRNDQVVHRTEEEEAEIVAEIVAVTEVDAVEVEIVAVMAAVIVAAQAVVVTRKAMVQAATGLHTKAVVDPIQADQHPVRIRIVEAAGLQAAANPGIKNKPGNRAGRRGFSFVNWRVVKEKGRDLETARLREGESGRRGDKEKRD